MLGHATRTNLRYLTRCYRRGDVKQLMENCIVNKKINNDFLSQSYSQGIERITGTKDNNFNFQIPKDLLEVREKTWENLFDKYSQEMSDEIELNVDTLEPVEEEEEKEVSVEQYSCGRRIPMRKLGTLVQYWVNTGNLPYKVLLDDLSETGSSISEKDVTLLSASAAPNALNAGDKQKCKNDSSCSSVDTAAYILSNTNVTKKVDTIAIIEGAKCVDVESSKDISIKDIEDTSNDKIEYVGTTRADCKIYNDGSNVNANLPDIELYSMATEHTALEIRHDQVDTSILISANAVQSNIHSQNLSCEETNKIDGSNTSQRNLDVQTIDDIASTFQHFDKTSKRLIGNDKNNDASNRDKMFKGKDTLHERQLSESITQEIIAKDTNMTVFHYKKLYTGRDSPVDLILTETHSTNRLSGARQSLHPALDSDGMIKRKTFLIHQGKNKHSLSGKTSLGFKKIKRKKRREFDYVLSKTLTDIGNGCTNNNEIQDSNIDSSFKNLSDSHNNLDKQDDIPFREYSDTNISAKNEKCKRNLASLNLKPVVLLERIKPSFKRHELKSGENTHIKHLNKSGKLHSCEIENLELEMIDSDESTILICQCNMNTSQQTSALNICSLDLKSNIEDDFSALNAERKDDKLSSSKDTEISQDKQLYIEGLPQSSNKSCTNATVKSQILNKNSTILKSVLPNKSKIHYRSYGKNNIDNVKLREIKVVLERLPLPVKNCTAMKMQVLNKNDTIWQKEMSDKSKTFSSNAHGTNEKNNAKHREIKIVLERLPPNVCLKESSNVTNISPNKEKISQNSNLQTNHKREARIRKISKISARENGAAARPVRKVINYSLRMNTKSKENFDDKMSDKFGIVVGHGSQISNKVKSDSTFRHKTFRHKNRNEVSQDNHSKYSVLTLTSSDEDDFVRSIQYPKKRSKVSIDDNILGETNIVEKSLYDQTNLVISDKDEYHYNGNLSTAICSSEKAIQRDTGPEKEKNEHGVFENFKSFGSMQMATASLQKNERFVCFSSENDNNAADNSDKCKERISSFNSNKNMNNNSKSHSSGAIKRNGIDRKDDAHVIFFQTKTFDTNSSDSEESNSYTSSTCKALKSSSIHDRLRHHNLANSEEIFNDSIAKRYSKRHLSSLNSSLEKHVWTHDVRTKSRSTDKESKSNKRLANEESNGDIKSRTNNTKEDTSFSPLITDTLIRDASVQEKTFLNTFLKETNLGSLSENKEIADKSKNAVVIQQGDVTSTVRKLLTFQTKDYYDSSDSSEIL